MVTAVESAYGLFEQNGLSGFSICSEEVMESDNSVNLITHRSDVDVWERPARRSWTIEEWLGQWVVPIAGASLLAYGTYCATRGSRRGVWWMASGVGLLVYSYTSLPREPRPEVSRGVNRWVATHTVEAEGCVQPTAPAAAVIVQTAPTSVIVQPGSSAPRSADTTERLRTLDKLKASGTISDAEYKRKRAEIVDGI